MNSEIFVKIVHEMSGFIMEQPYHEDYPHISFTITPYRDTGNYCLEITGWADNGVDSFPIMEETIRAE